MDLGMVDGAAPLNLTRPGTMSPDAPKPVQTQPAPQFDRTNAGPMLRQPPAPVPVPAVPNPVQQMVDSPMSAPVRNSINAAVANPQPRCPKGQATK